MRSVRTPDREARRVIVGTPLDLLSGVVYLALAGVVVVATRRRPADAVVALIATAPFAYYHYIGPTALTFGKVALVAAALGLLLHRPRPALFARGTPRTMLIAIVAVMGATALSILAAHDRGAALRETLKAGQYVLTFGVAALAWSLDPDRRRLRAVLLLTVAVVAVLALTQEVAGAPSGIWYHGRPYPRIAGPLEGPNQLAGYLGIVLPFVAVLALERTAWPALAVTVLAGTALVLTLSRSGLVAAFVAIGIVVALRPPLRRGFLVSLGASLVAAAAVLFGWHVTDVGSRFISLGEVEDSGGVGTRHILWRAAWVLWREHPFLGIGAGNFELSLPAVAPAGIKTHANSWYLQSLVEGGIPLLAATFALVWASAAPLLRSLRKDLCLAAFAASVAFALHGIFDLLVFFPKVAVTWFVVLGIAAIEAERAP